MKSKLSWQLVRSYEVTSEAFEPHCALLFLITLHWVADVWKIFLFSRQLLLASSTLTVPPKLRERMSSQDYDFARRQSLVSSTATISSATILLLVKTFKLYYGYHFYIWEFTVTQAETKFWRAIFYAVFDMLFSKLIALPFKLLAALMYSNASQMPLAAITIVSVVQIIVATIFTATMIACFMMVIGYFGPRILLYFTPLSNTIAMVLMAIYIQYFVPQRYSTLENEPSVHDSIKRLTTSVGYPSDKVYVNPDFNAAPNAYFIGVLGANMIMISRSLINMLGPQQLTAVVAHELGHWSKDHNIIHLALSVLEVSTVSIGVAYSYDSETLVKIFGFGKDKPQAIITLYMWIAYVSPLISDFLNGVRSVIGRLCEFYADDFACNVGLGSDLKAALLLLASKSTAYPIFDPLFSAWYLGHPTIFERVDRIENH
ncbi:hypothetical protein GE061_018242 [Apolygus lucorum]|uniref:Uncharacterized protein n=1 Tax=Apolygus lucorum TaxID=248454 RepID=A0A6A4J1F7_APOLU|nr:hypothetical protein GE061_018242 [Apolygus lucorum]